ncbi:MAG: Ig-like domain-containing protein [Dehalococcoidia bacterium]
MRRVLVVAGFFAVLLAIVGIAMGVQRIRPEPRPPAVIAYEPEQLREVPPNATISVAFNTRMDRPSVEAAFQLVPAVDGSFAWQGDTVAFTPSNPMERNTRYELRVGASARSISAEPLAEPFDMVFTTAGNLVPVAFYPADRTEQVPIVDEITVSFNRPVVALGSGAVTVDPLIISPTVSGVGRWVSPSVYRFSPQGGLRAATEYVVSLRRDVQDVTGGRLAGDVRYQFTTILPALSAFTPTANSRFVPPGQEILLIFNQPMNRESVQQLFTLTGPTGAATGAIRWESETRALFIPSQPLQPDVTYTAQIAAGLRGLQGSLPSVEPIRWSFQTIGPPRLVASEPANGSTPPSTARLSLTFNQPMDTASVGGNLTILPAPTQVFSSWTDSNTRLNFFFSLRPSTAYEIAVGADARDRTGRPLGAPQRVSFTTGPTPPKLELVREQNTTTVLAGMPLLGAFEAVNVPAATMRLFRIDRTAFIESDASFQRDPAAPLAGDLVGEWSLDTVAGLNASRLVSQTLSIGGAPVGPGFYELTLEGAGVRDRQLLVVSRRALTLKTGPGTAFVWAADPTTGQPVANATVGAFFSANTPVTTTQALRTGSDGALLFRLPDQQGNPWPRLWVFLDEPEGPSVVSSNWSDGIEPWQFGLDQSFLATRYSGALYTDRPIYRAGQLVFFKGIVRRDDDGAYSLPKDLPDIRLVGRDQSGRVVLSRTVTLDAFGSFASQIQLAETAATGYWSISATDPTGRQLQLATGFQVAEYRRPEFDVQVDAGRRDWVANETVTATVSANYFFGAPVTNADVIWRVRTDPFTFEGPTGPDWNGFTYGVIDLRPPPVGSGPLPTASGTGRLDSAGRYVLSFPAELSQFQGSRLFTIEGSITDESDQEISGRTETIVHKGAFYIGLRNITRLVRTGEPTTWDVAVVGLDKRPRAGVPIALDLATRRYYSVQERTPEGDLVWVTKFDDTPVSGGTQNVTTDASGRARATFTPARAGLYRLQATGRDERGNEVRTVDFLWVSGAEFVNWGLESNDRMDLVLDKAEYAVGETAKLLVPSPFSTSTALVTFERAGVRSHRVLALTSNSSVLDLQVEPDFLPNVFVSVLAFAPAGAEGPATFKLGYANLKVNTTSKRLTVETIPNQTRFRPGDTVRYRLKVTDSTGQPVSAQVSVALVDLAVLSLVDAESPTSLFDDFYRNRGLGVRTAATLAASQARLDLAQRAAGKGGGGESEDVRSRFADTAYWNPSIVTGPGGEATLEVRLPDNLTTWRLTAKAQTEDSRFGQGTNDIISTKDVLVRPVIPRFLTAGDEAQVEAIVQNLTDRAVDVTATLEVRNLAATSGTLAPQRMNVPARGTALARWNVKAAGPGEARLLFRADTGSQSPPGDAVELALPVNPLASPEVSASAGQVTSETTEEIQLDTPINRDLGELTIDLAPSLTSGLQSGVGELRAFPWEPNEVTVSRLLASLDYARVLSAAGTLSPTGASRLQDETVAALQKLYRTQQQDGGWGWFNSDPSQPFLSAYATSGLLAARRGGHTVDQNSLNRALGYLNQFLARPVDFNRSEDVNTRAYVLFVTADAGRPNTGQTGSLFERRTALGDYGRGYLLLALYRGNGDRTDSRSQTLLTELANSAAWSATGIHWSEPAAGRQNFGGVSRSTAVVLSALLAVDPQSPMIDPAVRWLMVERRSGWWGTTFDTAAALGALASYSVHQGDWQADFRYIVGLNGRQIGQGNVSQDAPLARSLVVQVRDLLLDAPNRLVLQRDANGLPGSTGRLYYTATLRTFRPGDQIAPRTEGIAVAREYLPAEVSATTTIRSGKVGDLIRVRLTIVAQSDLDYLVVEDPLFAGAEAVNPTLATTSIFDRTSPRQDWRFSNIDIRDDKVALFARSLPRGTYEFTYLVRLSSAGRFAAQPARASLMYFPEIWGRSGGSSFEVRE